MCVFPESRRRNQSRTSVPRSVGLGCSSTSRCPSCGPATTVVSATTITGGKSGSNHGWCGSCAATSSCFARAICSSRSLICVSYCSLWNPASVADDGGRQTRRSVPTAADSRSRRRGEREPSTMRVVARSAAGSMSSWWVCSVPWVSDIRRSLH